MTKQNRVAAVVLGGLGLIVIIMVAFSGRSAADEAVDRLTAANAALTSQVRDLRRSAEEARTEVASLRRELAMRAPAKAAADETTAEAERTGRLNGNDPDSGATIEKINLWSTAERRGVSGTARHGETVVLIECRRDLRPVMFRVRAGSAEGWVSELFLPDVAPF